MKSLTMSGAFVAGLVFAAASPIQAQTAAAPAIGLTIHAALPGPTINRDIFGQFAEHLGHGIYDGIWVGKTSKIPNIRGIRSDVVQALRAIKTPVVRWPGGCFAEEYHWRNGVGPDDKRVSTVNSNWGGALEPDTFGTDEFMDFINQIGSEAYLTVNLASGTPEEASQWLEYMTTDQPTTLGKARVANGRKAPYRVKYLGLGNESWGCGGALTPEEYTERMRVFARFVRNLNPTQQGADAMQYVAVGPDGDKEEYTEAVMKAWKSKIWSWSIDGLSLHAYTTGGWPPTYAATGFGEKQYATLLKETLGMDGLITDASTIMDKYDPGKKVSLVVDEWGAWLAPTPGTNPGFLIQKNSLRDALIAALNLDIFARHADRVRMTNIAQMINVLQAMIMTDGPKMVLTPTYYVYKMYVPFQDAQLIQTTFDPGLYTTDGLKLPQVDAIAARDKQGKIRLSIVNLDPHRPADISMTLDGVTATSASGEVLTASQADAVNTFDAPSNVTPRPISAQATAGRLELHLPPKSVTVVSLQ